MVSKSKPATRVINVMLDDDTYEIIEQYKETNNCNRSQAIRQIIRDATTKCTCGAIQR